MKLLFAVVLIASIGLAQAAYVNDEAFGLGNGAYITVNQTTFDNLTCCVDYKLLLNVSGSALTFTSGINKTITNPTWNNDNFTFNVSGTAGYINFSTTMLNASNSYSLTANGVFVESRNTTTENVVWFNYTGDAILSVTWDTPPTSITGLTNTTGNFWHNWTWTNPADGDFNHTLIYINGNFVISQSATFYNFTASAHNSSTISIRTVDTAGNVDQTWVNHTSIIPNNAPIQSAIGDKSVNEGSLLSFTISGIDADGDSITCSSNNTRGTLAGCGYSWTPNSTESGVYSFIYYYNDSYSGSDSEIITITVNDYLVLTTLVATNVDTDSATLNAQLDNHAGTDDIWFEYGSISGVYHYVTKKQSITGNGTVSFKLSDGYPIIPDKTYYYRAAIASESGNQMTFTTLDISQLSGYDFDKNWEALRNASFEMDSLAVILPLPFTDILGAIFWGIVFSIIFIIGWIRQGDVTNMALLGILIAGVILSFVPPEFVQIGQALLVVSIAGMLVSYIYKK